MAKLSAVTPGEDDWKTENDLRTLIDAEKIKGDKKRLKKALDLAARKKKEMDDLVDDGSEDEGSED